MPDSIGWRAHDASRRHHPPTLDPETSGRVFELLLGLVRETGLAALIATHNPELAGRMDRVLRLESGRVVPA